MASPIDLHFLLLSILLFGSSVLVQSRVPKNETFQFINQGKFGGLSVEYWADYRIVEAVYAYPFGLYFYNSSPNAYILSIGASPPHKIWMMPFVWDANRNDPVRENSTLTFGRDGNLVLADVDGRIVWQTNTANKGVTGISMQPNGNLVLHDKYGRFVWQSFHHPSDTLLAGQSLTLKGGEKLVSRTAYPDGREGQHSIVVDKKGLIIYLNNSGNVLQYAGWEAKGLSSVTFDSVHEEELTTSYFLTLGFAKQYAPSKRILLKKVNYNYLHSFLRIEFDGNLRLHTANTEPDYMSWGVDYEYFGNTVEECALYRKCGLTGFCDRSICGSCPRKGSLGCMIDL
ncbi:EP1-like glycoprotein 2 [Papaver somniferum]|uniref:EP1-like glycoprotein 2 n=1 Tax=Papaver somniferum TaxID=3469 RepID=UPI000E6FA4D9|nr:EP1-like glycoprotein 2 [Papaver somniferum]